jgi:hypothetical protein
MMTETHAARLMGIALSHVEREYPHKLDHVLEGPADVQGPRALHPIFHGSFDWHSCVHGWWLILSLAHRFPGLPEAQEGLARALALFTPGNVARETGYVLRPASAGFERPYGWGWCLALQDAADAHPGLCGLLDPLARAFADRFRDFLPRLTYPIRAGTHGNTAFACLLALEWAGRHDPELARLIRARARDWFLRDRDCQAWEPSGDDFLSPALMEALLMQAVLGPDFPAWMEGFLPRLARGQPATLFTPARVSDRSDGKIAHLDGLNLSRAWAWARLAPAVSGIDALAIARDHLDTALPHLETDYAGAHWLQSFAGLALLAMPADGQGMDRAAGVA